MVLAVAGVLLLCVGTLLAGAFVSGRMGGGRYPPYPKEPAGAYSPPTELQKRWALALSAVLTEQNNDRHDILAGVEGRPEQVMAVHDRLAYSWEIYTREDLLGTLEWIEAEGHRREFDRSAGQTGGKGIAAWDYGRYVALCRWGFAMGFLTEEEAWQRIMPVARLMQSVYPSWAEYGQSYVAGREYWSPDDGAASMVRSIESNLLSAPRSPWMQLPWDADLSTGADSR